MSGDSPSSSLQSQPSSCSSGHRLYRLVKADNLRPATAEEASQISLLLAGKLARPEPTLRSSSGNSGSSCKASLRTGPCLHCGATGELRRPAVQRILANGAMVAAAAPGRCCSLKRPCPGIHSAQLALQSHPSGEEARRTSLCCAMLVARAGGKPVTSFFCLFLHPAL